MRSKLGILIIQCILWSKAELTDRPSSHHPLRNATWWRNSKENHSSTQLGKNKTETKPIEKYKKWKLLCQKEHHSWWEPKRNAFLFFLLPDCACDIHFCAQYYKATLTNVCPGKCCRDNCRIESFNVNTCANCKRQLLYSEPCLTMPLPSLVQEMWQIWSMILCQSS